MERVEAEIDRLFKTNVFNTAARTQEKNNLFKKYPALGNMTSKETKYENLRNDKLTQRARIMSQMPSFKVRQPY